MLNTARAKIADGPAHRKAGAFIVMVVWGAAAINWLTACSVAHHRMLPDDEYTAIGGAIGLDYATVDAGRRSARFAVQHWRESVAHLRFHTDDLDHLAADFPPHPGQPGPKTQALYAETASGDVAPLFIKGFTLSQSGQEILQLIAEVGSHGFDESGYYESELRCILSKLTSLSDIRDDELENALTTDEHHLLRALATVPNIPTNPDGFEQFAQVHLPTLWRHMSRIKPTLAERGEWIRQADFLLARAFIRLLATHRGDYSGVNDPNVTVDDIRTALRQPKATIASLTPWTPQYSALQQAYSRYRRLGAENSVQPLVILKPSALKARYVGQGVVLLRKRLAQEGYVSTPNPGVPEDLFDDSLVDALGLYQSHRQLEPTGKLDAPTLKSLNVSMQTRAAQIAVALRQWRQSKINEESAKVFVQVNIPAFEAHFFKDRERKRSHRVVVGNNGWVNDKIINKKGFLNRTGLMSSTIQTVILNPAWRVPPRIKQDELDKEQEEDSSYYERHNFVVTVNSDGTESVMQRPGPGNALGIVKMAFPNSQGIYMHDTAQKEYFNRPVRAYSHGCVRLQDPMEAASFLLQHDGSHAAGNESAILKSRKETEVRLNTPVPIHIEYIPVSVDDNGRVLFHSDIYSMLSKKVAEIQKHLFDGAIIQPTETTQRKRARCGDDVSTPPLSQSKPHNNDSPTAID